jgi:folate-binding protein YgfZ
MSLDNPAARLTLDDAARTPALASSSSVLVVPAEGRAAIKATGKDAVSWLNGLVTCDLAKRAAGDAAYGLLVEKKGRIRVDLFIVPDLSSNAPSPSFALFVPAAKRDEVMALLDHHLIMEDVELAAVDLALFLAHGPKAGELAALTEVAPFRGTLDVLGRGGAALAVPLAERERAAVDLAREAGLRGGVLASDEAWEGVRIEAGVPRFGVEVDDTLYPQEASLEKLAVSFTKGCYLGQEVVYMLENRGHVKRKLVPLDLDGDAPPTAGDAVATPEGEVVGEVRSGTIGPLSGKPVAIAMLKYAQTKPGTALVVGGRAAHVRA